MIEKVPFSQLWLEEEQLLFTLAQDLPGQGSIVELGTAQGGSAFIFDAASKNKDISIHSFDLRPSAEAFVNLKETKVEIHACSSIDGARQWGVSKNPIELLFVDASHTLAGVASDYNAWVDLLSKKTMVVFHDFDPIDRGGSIHLGVQVLVECLLRSGRLKKHARIGRCLAGTVGFQKPVAAAEIMQTWSEIQSEARAKLLQNFKNQELPCSDQNLFSVLRIIYDERSPMKLVDLSAKTSTSPAIVAHRLNHTARLELETLSNKTAVIDELTVCIGLQAALKDKWDEILTVVDRREILFKVNEQIEMLEEATSALEQPQTLPEVSAMIAKEQMRIGFLLNLRDSLGSKK